MYFNIERASVFHHFSSVRGAGHCRVSLKQFMDRLAAFSAITLCYVQATNALSASGGENGEREIREGTFFKMIHF